MLTKIEIRRLIEQGNKLLEIYIRENNEMERIRVHKWISFLKDTYLELDVREAS